MKPTALPPWASCRVESFSHNRRDVWILSRSPAQLPITEREFLYSPYVGDENGFFRPSRGISRCPFAGTGELCKIEEHSYRDRKTGPKIALCVLYCAWHKAHFTVYPPGYVPYARTALAAVDLGGKAIERLEPEPQVSSVGFREMLMEAAMDASFGRLWESEPIENLECPRYPTQRRRTALCARLLGLSPELPEPVVAQIRDYLGLCAADHEPARRRFQSTNRLAMQGEVVVGIHGHSAHGEQMLVPRLLAAGHLSGVWGHPWFWDADRGQRFSALSRCGQVLREPP